MGVFDDITLEWRGEKHMIKSDRVMGAIRCIEQHTSLQELTGYLHGKLPPLTDLAAAWGSVLRYAGAKVTDEEAYSGIFPTGNKLAVVTACSELLKMMIPPEHLRDKDKEHNPGNERPAASNSSKKRSSSRSRGG